MRLLAGLGTEAGLEVLQSQEIAGTLLAAADGCGLQNCWQWKPLLDGKQVNGLFLG